MSSSCCTIAAGRGLAALWRLHTGHVKAKNRWAMMARATSTWRARLGGSPAVPSWTRMLLVPLAVATMLELYLAYTTYGTDDITRWETFLSEAIRKGALGLYQSDPFFNHPPFMVSYIRGLGQVAAVTHVPFRFWLRAGSSMADIGSFALVVAIARRSGLGVSRSTLYLLALAPVSVMVAGFHGNTDPVMVLFVLLAVYLHVSKRPVWTVGLALGMALNIKFAAVIFTPAIFFATGGGRRRALLIVTAGLTVALASMPYLLQDPALIERKVVGYASISDFWGITRVLVAGPRELHDAYLRYAPAVIAVGVAAVCFGFSRRRSPPSLFLQCGISGSAFLVFTPGFGVQYLAWLVPWVVILAFGSALFWYAATGAFLFVVYTIGSGGFPWYHATDPRIGHWVNVAAIPAAIAWSATLMVLVAMLRRATGRAPALAPTAETNLPLCSRAS